MSKNPNQKDIVTHDSLHGMAIPIENILNLDDINKPSLKVDDIANEPISLLGFEEKMGESGKYYLLEVFRAVTQETILVSSGGAKVMRALDILQRENAFPVNCKIIQVGRYKEQQLQPLTIDDTIQLG